MKEKATWFIVGILYIATVMALVRPGSKGTQIVTSISNTLTDLVRGVTGQTYSQSTGKWSTSNG